MEDFLNKENLIDFVGKIGDEENTDVYLVGGYIRNEILNLKTEDIDFLVMGDGVRFAKITAERLKIMNPLEFGEFGTAVLWYKDLKIEFAGARKEIYAPDSRKPKVMEGTIVEDIKRRDFTINTLVRKINFRSKGDIIDLFGGIQDINKKLIRTPIDPNLSFRDDPLRMLRAIRFAAQFGFRIEKSTYTAMKNMKERINIVSKERITNELMKMLSLKRPSLGFKLLGYSGFLKIILPELDSLSGIENQNGYLHKDVFLHTLKVVDNVAQKSDSLNLRFTALMHDIAKPLTKRFLPESGWTFYGHDELGSKMVKDIVKRMKLPSSIGDYAQKLIRMHLRPISLSEENVTDSAIRRFVVEAGDYLEDLMTLCKADITSGNPQRAAVHLENFNRVVKKIEEVKEKDKLREFKSPVNGLEIMKVCNIKPGRKVGILKKKIEDAILDGIIPNDHDKAFEYLLKIKESILAE